MGLIETFGIDNNKKNFKSKNNDDLDLPNTQSYIYAIELMRICWNQMDVIDSLNFLVLFYM